MANKSITEFQLLHDTLRELPLTGDTLMTVLFVMAALLFLLLIGWVATAFRMRRISRQLVALNRGIDGQNLVEILAAHMDAVDATVRRMETLEQAVAVLQAQIPYCLQKVHLVRYNAFADVGGEQSFAVALLNGHGDGIVFSSICSRNDIRVYAKSIQNGQPTQPLSAEEERVMREVYTR